MNEIMAIAGSTWRRILRMRVVYFLIVCVLILIGSAYNYDVFSMGMHKELMIDVSLVLNTIAAILIAVSITFEIPKELKEGVASTLLTKPLGRTQYLVGKLVGIIIAGLVITGLITLGFMFVFNTAFGDVTSSMLKGHILIMASIIPMSAMAVLFSVFTSEFLAATITVVAIWFAHTTSSVSRVKFLYGGLLPDLNLYNLRAEAVYGGITSGYILVALVWGIVFSVFATALASLIFSYKDLK
jgi:ABC-type transport system involved in multi-copper enzyme maturation permease subunit